MLATLTSPLLFDDPWMDFQITAVAIRQLRADEAVRANLELMRSQQLLATGQEAAQIEAMRTRLAEDARHRERAERRAAYRQRSLRMVA